jgi:hypothetical protein
MNRPDDGRNFTQKYLKTLFPRENEFSVRILNEALNLYKELEKQRNNLNKIVNLYTINDAITRNNYNLKIKELHRSILELETEPDITPFDAVEYFKFSYDQLNEEKRRQERIKRNLERFRLSSIPSIIAQRTDSDLQPRPIEVPEDKPPDMEYFDRMRDEARIRRNEFNSMERMERRQRNLERFNQDFK